MAIANRLLGRTWMLPVGILLGHCAPAVASEEARWSALETRYRTKLARLEQRFRTAGVTADPVAEAQQQVAALDAQIKALREKLDTQATWTQTWRLLAEPTRLLDVFFPILVLNLLLYLRRSHEPPLRLSIVAWVALTVLVLFALPALAAEAEPSSGDQGLKTLNDLLNAPPAAKGLFWLKRLQGEGRVPAIRVKDDLLTPREVVTRDGAEYFFTVAALAWDLNQRDEAFRALRRIAGASSGPDGEDVYDRTIRFISREKADELAEVGTALLPKMSDRVRLARLAVYLRNQEELRKRETSILAARATQRLSELASAVGDLLEPLDVILQAGQRQLGTELLARARGLIRRVSDGQALCSVALRYDLDSELDALVDQATILRLEEALEAPGISRALRERAREAVRLGVPPAEILGILRTGDVSLGAQRLLPLAEQLFQGGKSEPGRRALGHAINAIEVVDEVRPLVEFSLKHNEYQSAIRALEKAVDKFGPEVASRGFADPQLLYVGEELPGDDYVSMAVLLAILDEKAGIAEGAPPAYARGLEHEVELLLNAAAFSFPANLRSLFYVERYWRKKQEFEQLARLRRPYQRVQMTFLSNLADAQKQKRVHVRALRAREEQERAELVRVRRSLWRVQFEGWAWRLRLGALAAAAVMILVGCARRAWRYSKHVGRFRTYVGVWRFIEGLGWVSVMSAIGVATGLAQVAVAQLFLLVKGIEEPEATHHSASVT